MCGFIQVTAQGEGANCRFLSNMSVLTPCHFTTGNNQILIDITTGTLRWFNITMEHCPARRDDFSIWFLWKNGRQEARSSLVAFRLKTRGASRQDRWQMIPTSLLPPRFWTCCFTISHIYICTILYIYIYIYYNYILLIVFHIDSLWYLIFWATYCYVFSLMVRCSWTMSKIDSEISSTHMDVWWMYAAYI